MGAIADTDEETEFPEEVRQKTQTYTKAIGVLQPPISFFLVRVLL